jgi:hypothetical protein
MHPVARDADVAGGAGKWPGRSDDAVRSGGVSEPVDGVSVHRRVRSHEDPGAAGRDLVAGHVE